jgi:hypothetical protein
LFTTEKKMRKTEEGVVQGRKAAKNTSLQLSVRSPLTLQDEQQSAKDHFHQHVILPCKHAHRASHLHQQLCAQSIPPHTMPTLWHGTFTITY